jgi:RNA polymerase sigma-70 factor (ECF subfamily)
MRESTPTTPSLECSGHLGTPATQRTPRRLEPERLGDYFDRLYRAAVGMCGSHADAEDLVQETYSRVLRKPRLLRSHNELGYLLRAMRNVWYTRYAHTARGPRLQPLTESEPALTVAAETVVESQEIIAAVARLPEPYRDVIAAVDFAGLSYRDAARALGVRQGTIMSRLFRARERVAAELGAGKG